MSDFINRYLSFLSKMTEILSTLAALCCDTVILLNVILFGNLDCGNLNIFKMLNPELIFLRLYSLQIVKPKSEVQSPKVKTKRTWADTKITWATTTWPTAHHHMADCTFPPITFKHEGVLW